MAGGENLRIGDAERDEAIVLLREHMSAGRITAEEFDERMSAALTAKTRGELTVLFNDLPGRTPGDPYAAHTPAPVQPVMEQHPAAKQSKYKPLAIVVVLTLLAMSLRHWGIPLLMLGLLLFYVLNLSGESRSSRHQLQQQPPRGLHPPEREELVALLRQNQRLLAIKRYREMTGANLLTAKNAIDALHDELGR
ncbi:DUF1707 domain-containing protein [Arachnia propionica]|uniref:DUF1707 domain-containing protein n=1 Tax=Arachnia propionica TaxID=1750 RepID=UPI000F70816D|nr:DUF1707 domain-containing protein [Arachnia propionica]VEJ58069.1 Domain of uncharacterised function (DUF1707) [Arachnia propionica]